MNCQCNVNLLILTKNHNSFVSLQSQLLLQTSAASRHKWTTWQGIVKMRHSWHEILQQQQKTVWNRAVNTTDIDRDGTLQSNMVKLSHPNILYSWCCSTALHCAPLCSILGWQKVLKVHFLEWSASVIKTALKMSEMANQIKGGRLYCSQKPNANFNVIV